jgi:hypothetical protein
MNTYTRKPLFQAIVTTWTFMLCLGASTLSFAQDSTQVTGRQNIAVVQPQAQPDTTQCIEANTNEHLTVAGNSWNGAWKTSACPTGYMPYEFQSSMIAAGIGDVGASTMYFRNYCCKVKVVYPAKA